MNKIVNIESKQNDVKHNKGEIGIMEAIQGVRKEVKA